MERIYQYAMTAIGCVFLAHLFVAWPLINIFHLSDVTWVYILAALVGLFWVWRTPATVYCRCPTCGTRVAEDQIKVSV